MQAHMIDVSRDIHVHTHPTKYRRRALASVG